VDQCPNCGGYWLDAGELEKIRAEKAAAAEPKPAQGGSMSIEVIRYLYRVKITGGDQP
jgi:Zn-finger nucleic acid-binding protein